MQPTFSHWFRNKVLYQIYPRSFYDSNNDGVGDLEGVRQKLDYLVELGIGAVWLSPFYPSPMADFGYDVSDYKNVDPLFGTLDDFKALLHDMHEKGLKLMIDFIPNHTSDKHQWFQESRSSVSNPKRNWYTWHEPGESGGPPNNWLSAFGGSAWELDEASGQYYLHSFLKEQPDLNWENKDVRDAINDAARFWLELGVDGFRIDTLYWISKDPDFRDDPINPDFIPETDDPFSSLRHKNSHNGPKLFRYFNEFVRMVKTFPEKFIVLEVFPEGDSLNEDYAKLYEHMDPSICAPFNFEGIKLPWSASEFEDFVASFESFMEPFYLPVFCMSNHDQPRIVNRIGPDAARVMAMMQLTLPGLPIIYYGDELGMVGEAIPVEKVQDPFEKQVPGKGLGRDSERTPMQWSATENAGFSNAEPWLPVSSAYITNNVETQNQDSNSMLNLYKSLIALRADNSTLKYGEYKSRSLHRNVFCYVRTFSAEITAVVLNFSNQEVILENDLLQGLLLLSTDPTRKLSDVDKTLELSANEGVVIRLV